MPKVSQIFNQFSDPKTGLFKRLLKMLDRIWRQRVSFFRSRWRSKWIFRRWPERSAHLSYS